MIHIQIKDIRAIASDVAVDESDNLIFARLILGSIEEVRGLRHAIQEGKLVQSDVGFLVMNRQALTWAAPRTHKGVTVWLLTMYAPVLEDRLYIVLEHGDGKSANTRKLEAYLHQYTPYPIPPIQDVYPILRAGEAIPVFGESGAVLVYAFTQKQIIEILEDILK